MKRNNRRRSNGTAVLSFFIGLLIVILLAGTGLLILKNGKGGANRPYVPTGTGEPIPPEPMGQESPEPTFAPYEPANSPQQTVFAPVVTAEPTPEPTPDPTAVPRSSLPTELKKFSLPEVSQDGEIGISNCYVSVADGYSIMELTGWGYANLTYFDGRQSGTYLIVKDSSGKAIHAYLATNDEGISGVSHTGFSCKNPAACDWRVYIDVSEYDSGVYTLGLALAYKNGDKDEYRYYEFGELQSFTVNDGEIIMPVIVTSAE